MSKRKGRKPLNLDASDDDSEPEEPGVMVQASEAVIKNRVMKVAKRRLAPQSSEGGVFGSLNAKNCLKSQPSISVDSAFAFLRNSNAATGPAAATSNPSFSSFNGKLPLNTEKHSVPLKSSPAPTSVKSELTFKRACVDSPDSNLKQGFSLPVKSNSSTNADNKIASSVDIKELTQKEGSNPILETVKILNIECIQWAQQHMDENPVVDLRPVFADYKQHFEAILEEYRQSEASKPKESNASSETLVKLQKHIKTKNSLESKDDSRKEDSRSSLKNIYSVNSDAEMKSKILESSERVNYISSLLGSKSSPNKTETLTPAMSLPPNSDSSLKLQSTNVTNYAPKSDTSQASPFSFGKPSLETSKTSEASPFSFSKPGSETSKTSETSPFSFSKPSSETSKTGMTSPFSFGKPSSETPKTSEASPGSFLKIPGLANNCFSNPSIFSKDAAEPKTESLFGNVAPSNSIFSLGGANAGAGAQQKTEAEEEDDEDQPPVIDVKPIVEEGAKYTARCKVFIKKEDNSYGDRGVGTLSLKALENSNKFQVVVRAESTLGNILVNVLLSKDIPLQRTGKNNVLLVCLPTPDCEPPPKVVLLRVKTEEEADQLYKTLKDAQA